MIQKEHQTAYQHAYRLYLRARKRNDPLSDYFGKEPVASEYGLIGPQGDWLAARLRAEVEKELEG